MQTHISPLSSIPPPSVVVMPEDVTVTLQAGPEPGRAFRSGFWPVTWEGNEYWIIAEVSTVLPLDQQIRLVQEAAARQIPPAHRTFGQGPTPQAPTVQAGTISGRVGTALTFQIGASQSPTSFDVTPALPAGLTLNATNGQITGTPTTVQPATTYQMTATNAIGTSMPANLIITITPPVPVVSPGTITGTTGTAITPFQIVATNSPTSYAVTPALPTNLALNTTTGQITGTPTAAGNVTRTITATNAGGTSAGAQLTINIAAGLMAPVVTPGQSVSSTVGIAITPFQIATTGGAPTSFNITTGALPTGLSMSTTGQITGTPAANTSTGSPYSVNVTATNATGTSPAVALTVNVAAGLVAPIITAGQSITAVEGAAIATFTIATTGGAPASFAIASGTLPTGLNLNTANGQITGTPAVSGSTGSPHTITVTATNAAGTSPAVAMSITITAPGSVPHSPSSPAMFTTSHPGRDVSPTQPNGSPWPNGATLLDEDGRLWAFQDGQWKGRGSTAFTNEPIISGFDYAVALLGTPATVGTAHPMARLLVRSDTVTLMWMYNDPSDPPATWQAYLNTAPTPPQGSGTGVIEYATSMPVMLITTPAIAGSTKPGGGAWDQGTLMFNTTTSLLMAWLGAAWGNIVG